MVLPEPGSWKCWILASRPKTLFAAVAPVMLGTALASHEGSALWLAALAALAGAVFIQIGTNFANDYWDGTKGTDTADRLGPVRVTSAGLLKPRTVLLGTAAAFALACVAGVVLIAIAGWPVVVIGAISILCGLAYTAGPFPLAYVGLGDVFSFVFFGLVATAGTYFVQTGEFSWWAVLLGCMPGWYSVVLLTLNNLRDVEQDRAGNKRTLAVRFGAGFARAEIAVGMVSAALVPLCFVGILGWVGAGFCTVAGWIFASAVIVPVFKGAQGAAINQLFPRTGMASLVMAVFFTVALCFL